MEKLVAAFRNFANASNNGIFRDVEHRVHSRVLTFRNVARFHGTRANVIGF